MGRRTITINLKPHKAEPFIKLCENIVEQNNTMGASSPFADGSVVNMTAFGDLVTRARQKRDEALELYAAAEATMAESRVLMGVGPGQTINTTGTLYYLANKVKGLLVTLSTENPEELSVWGFNVVIRLARARGKNKAKEETAKPGSRN